MRPLQGSAPVAWGRSPSYGSKQMRVLTELFTTVVGLLGPEHGGRRCA
jgi:hypothetical protein